MVDDNRSNTNKTLLIEIQGELANIKEMFKRSKTVSYLQGVFLAGLPLLGIGLYKLVSFIVDTCVGKESLYEPVDGATLLIGLALFMYAFSRLRGLRKSTV